MAEHTEEEATEAAEREMERDAGEMEEGVERLGSHIEDAERAAQERPGATQEETEEPPAEPPER